ncbi:MAG: CPBP family intramembrane metalloprotease [Propionibacteriaceae bacterium]|nr:CPBP family intramembrane metalloprotease [Propionibacteriaceae bacterium]
MNGLRRPAKGLPYSLLLEDFDAQGLPKFGAIGRCLIGIFVLIVSFILIMPYLVFALAALFWVLGGAQGPIEQAFADAQALNTPSGMLARHLGIGLMIGLCYLIWVLLNRVEGRWLASVQPGFRWRLALLGLFPAAVAMFLCYTFSVPSLPTWNPQDNWVWFLVVILLTSPIQAAAEEYIFRGYLLNALGSAVRNKWAAVVVSALFFAGFHGTQNLPLFVDRFGFGLISGALVILTGGLECSIAAHAANNMLSFAIAATTSSVATALATSQATWINAVWDLAGWLLAAAVLLWLARKLNAATETPASSSRA